MDFKEKADNILRMFSNWLIDIKGGKITNPLFYKGYIDNNEVNSIGKRIVGSGYVSLYQFPISQEINTSEIVNIFKEIDISSKKLKYLEGSENIFDKRRKILLSKDTIASYKDVKG